MPSRNRTTLACCAAVPSMLTSGFSVLLLRLDGSVAVGGPRRLPSRQLRAAGTHKSEVSGSLRWRVSQRLVLQPVVAFTKSLDDLQYIETAETSGGPRTARPDRPGHARGHVPRGPANHADLSIQYYGSPFVSTGRYTTFKHVTAPHADDYANRFHVLTNDELASTARRTSNCLRGRCDVHSRTPTSAFASSGPTW